MADVKLVITYVTFIVAVIWLTGLAAKEFGTGKIISTKENIEPPDCSNTNALVCVASNLGYFFKLMLISTSPSWNWVKTIILTPLLVGLFYLIVRLIRGGG